MNIPKGYKLVPVEPTEEMLEVLHGSVKIQVDTWERTEDIINDKEWWSAVVDSAPTPPQPIYDEAAETQLARFSYDADPNLTASWSDFKYGWLACAQSRAKAWEVSP